MPYNIEIMCIGEDRYSLLERAANALNGIQDQFIFTPTHASQRGPGIMLKRSEFVTQDIWEFLHEQRSVGAPRPFIIAFVNKPLRSSRLSNLFGSHDGEHGLAVATTHGFFQFIKDEERYVRYYLVRYALSFVNWTIKSHNDPGREHCYFHKKMDKREIVHSIYSAEICDHCMVQLDAPAKDSDAHTLTELEKEALEKIRLFVAGEYPYSLVMKGGGVKGLALAGALLELEKHYSFNRHVGTSAGAIAAVLLAAGYTPSELIKLLREKDFKDFLDAPGWKMPINLIFKKGLFPGEVFRIWVANLLTEKLGLQSEVKMKDLESAIVFAARAGNGALTFDSNGENRDTVASFAVRCSMAIPLFFTPTEVAGRRVYDGGLRNNFPLKRFLESFPDEPFLAIYLGKAENKNSNRLSKDLLDIVVDGEEKQLVDDHSDSVVVIDTTPVGTVDFGLTQDEKNFLLQAGRAAALSFLSERGLENGPSAKDVEEAQKGLEDLRSSVISRRSKRTRRRRMAVVGILSAAGIAMMMVALFYR